MPKTTRQFAVDGRFGWMLQAAIVLVGLFIAGRAVAIPNTGTHPHCHVNPGTTDFCTTWINGADPVPDPDPDDPDATMHQHRDTDNITGGNGKYIGYSVWDDRNYRVGGDWGHGYQPLQARYIFDNDFDVNGKTDFNNAVVEWETKVNGGEVNTNGVNIDIKLGFNRVASGAHEIDVIWDDIGVADMFATAFWDPGATDFTFDSAPTVGIGAPAGFTARLAGSADPFTATVQGPNTWHFGGAGAVGSTTTWLDCRDGLNVITLNCASSTYDEYDFYTIALHEIGHAFGLKHFGTGIMRTDISSFVMRDPDAGSIDGLKDLYAITVIPEPSTAILVAGGMLVMLGMGRRMGRR
jgi:hypothetical protein